MRGGVPRGITITITINELSGIIITIIITASRGEAWRGEWCGVLRGEGGMCDMPRLCRLIDWANCWLKLKRDRLNHSRQQF